MKPFVFNDIELRGSYARLGIWIQFKQETNAYGDIIHTAFISPHLSVQPQFHGGEQLQTSIIIRLQGQLLIDPDCYLMPVRSKQSTVAGSYKLGSSLYY